jgi:EPS-associated MarR family transcriptional regulator
VEKTFKMVGNLKKKEGNVSQEITLQLMAHVEQNPQDTQRAIASELGVSLGSVNYCIKALINKGFLKVENFRKSSNKLGYAYLLTPSGIGEKANLTLSFLKRKQQEYNRLEREIAELQEEVAKLEERKSS